VIGNFAWGRRRVSCADQQKFAWLWKWLLFDHCFIHLHY